MLPFHSSFPQLPNQTQTPSSSAPNRQQNSMPIQPHFGGGNPQIPIPFSNSGNFLSNGHGVPMTNVPPSMVTQPGFMNAQNHLLPLQNSNLGMPYLASSGPIPQMGQPHVGFGSQGSVNNMNSVGSFPFRGQVCNLAQQGNPSPSPGQAFGNNLLNLPQQLNQSMGLPFAQLCMPNQFQNINQFLPMQMSNPSQFVPRYNAFGFLNQASQATVPQNPTFLANSQFGNVQSNQVGQQDNQNQHNLHPPTVDVNAWRPSQVGTQQWQGNSSTPNIPSSIQPDKTDNLQPSAVKGFQNSQFHHMKNGKKKFGFPNGQKGKGLRNEMAGKAGIANSSNQGREQRSRDTFLFPENVEDISHCISFDFSRKLAFICVLLHKYYFSFWQFIEPLLWQQLKEILAKQAELGVEVAEIPSHYLSDSKKQGHGREESRGPMTRNERLQNKFDKRGRYDKKDRFGKKRRLHNDGSSDVPSLSRRKPTLLQKLLDTDVRRDKSRLLQVFRFMSLNSFFKDWPGKPLDFPSVIVKESGCGDNVVEATSPHAGKDVAQEEGEIIN
ncbi:hypothetical protein FEM48_Zijuj03G0027600 [Ziziphus jujuba var. spinosa]|uniref:Uncharacterized protein n=1 Tax=Ziziphus jujuba var. spinosa TaxID=714518 RepID=A0A978VMQ1_ZIZJJ|nr:hypothetical protein FEM48_Zijuj03G0027600 [Ziziphus jujuba var. spinosa]